MRKIGKHVCVNTFTNDFLRGEYDEHLRDRNSETETEYSEIEDSVNISIDDDDLQWE